MAIQILFYGMELLFFVQKCQTVTDVALWETRAFYYRYLLTVS